MESRLLEIKERSWKVREMDEDGFDDTPGVETDDGTYIAQTSYDGLSCTCRPTMYADAEFIAHAKADVEWLIQQLEVVLGK